MSNYEYTTKRNALLIGYYIRDQLNQQPTVEKIEHILNQPNIDELLTTMENLLEPHQIAQLNKETREAMN